MISKFGKMRDSWFTKAILTITALSFMSLFGVTGYINTANSNKTVLKVDNIEISQSEFSYMLQREIAKFKALTEDNADVDDEFQAQIANSLLQTKLADAILDNTMKKYKVDFSDSLIRSIILNMPQFSANGAFDYDQYKWFLNRSGLTENDFVADVKRNIARKILLDSQVAYANVPNVLRQQMQKVLGQRRTFKYIKIVGADAKVTRQPTDEELDQYYDDLKEEFMIPEKRDISVLYLSEKMLEDAIVVSDEEIASYYKEHIEEYEQPEKRFVLQMVFETQDDAQNAYARITAGEDFAKVAEENGQKTTDIELGYVSRNDLTSELADIVFSTQNGAVSKPENIADSWQIIKVNGIKAPHKTAAEAARHQIISEIKQDKIYDDSYETISDIEDKIGSGTSLAEVASSYKVSLREVKGVDEEGNADGSKDLEAVLKDKDFLEEIFSYNEGETTRVIETDDGVVVAQIEAIHERHPQSREDATVALRTMWLENEKASIIQELIDNIEHDIEAGDDVLAVARRYHFYLKNTMPITRGETFDNLTFAEMRELFAQPKNYATVTKLGDDYIIAETTNIYDDAASLSKEDKKFLDEALAAETGRELSDALLKDFASDYKIEVNYNRAGLGE